MVVLPLCMVELLPCAVLSGWKDAMCGAVRADTVLVTFNTAEKITLQPQDGLLSTEDLTSTSLQETDLEPCASNAVMHKVRRMMVPQGYTLPESAQPRTPTDTGARRSFTFFLVQVT